MERALRRLVSYLVRRLPNRQPPPEDPTSRAAIRKRLLLDRLTVMLERSTASSPLAISLPLYMAGLSRMSGAEIAEVLDQAWSLVSSLEAEVDAECSVLVVETDNAAALLAFPDRGERGQREIDARSHAVGELPQ